MTGKEFKAKVLDELRMELVGGDKNALATLVWVTDDASKGMESISCALERVWQEAYAAGYERGKSDERDAVEIDKALKAENPAGDEG